MGGRRRERPSPVAEVDRNPIISPAMGPAEKPNAKYNEFLHTPLTVTGLLSRSRGCAEEAIHYSEYSSISGPEQDPILRHDVFAGKQSFCMCHLGNPFSRLTTDWSIPLAGCFVDIAAIRLGSVLLEGGHHTFVRGRLSALPVELGTMLPDRPRREQSTIMLSQLSASRS